MRIAFTGSRAGLTPDQRTALRHWLVSNHVSEIHHGACVGADAEFAVIAFEATRSSVHAHPSNLPGMTDYDAMEIACCQHDPKAPLDRNRVIVASSDLVLVCPKGIKEEVRSGTWMTYRYARDTGKPVIIFWPDGSVSPS